MESEKLLVVLAAIKATLREHGETLNRIDRTINGDISDEKPNGLKYTVQRHSTWIKWATQFVFWGVMVPLLTAGIMLILHIPF